MVQLGAHRLTIDRGEPWPAHRLARRATGAAGLEAALLGTPALCLSQQSPPATPGVDRGDERDGRVSRYHFGLAARLGSGLAESVGAARLTEPVVLNVNYPAAAAAGGQPATVLTRPGQRAYPRASMRDWDRDPGPQQVYLFGEPDEVIPAADDGPDTDLAAVRGGRISVTPLSVAVGLDELAPAVTALLGPLLGYPGAA